MDRCRSIPKTWIIMRGQKILTFDLPAGTTGAQVDSKIVDARQYDAIVNQYKQYCRDQNKE
jgi:hypothetical protein